MARKIQTAPKTESGYITWTDNDGLAKALASFGQSLSSSMDRTQSSYVTSFVDVDTNVNARNEYGYRDFEYFRPSMGLPVRPKDILSTCTEVHRTCGLIRNIIDLMGDFGAQGINIVHPNPGVQKFYRAWWKKINGQERSERFLNNLYLTGNVFVYRENAKLKPTEVEKLRKTIAAKEFVEIPPDPTVLKNEIPWLYTFINPQVIELIGADLAGFFGIKPLVAIKLPSTIKSKIRFNQNAEEQAILNQIPQSIRNAVATSNKEYWLLDQNKVKSFFYKKNDWEVWATPMLYSILTDIQNLDRMKLADRSALDGAISSIRLWKIGSLEHRILPTPELMMKLANILTNNVGGGTMDLIWGPDLEMIESKTSIHQFLGESKYIPVLNAIYAGLGIPQTLTGTASGGSSFTNNFISLKTLIERLEYGRDMLRAFWDAELELIRKARGFRLPAEIHFDSPTLSDEASEKQLLLKLAEGNYISTETLLERFGEKPVIERTRTKNEYKMRKAGRMVRKATPFENPEPELDLQKIVLQNGVATPAQVGLELQPKKKGEVPLAEQEMQMKREQMEMDQELAKKQQEVDFELQKDQHEFDKGLKKIKQDDDQKIKRQQIKAKPKGRSGQGRPSGGKDTTKRKKRVTKIRKSVSSLDLDMWAFDAQRKSYDMVVKSYLALLGKKTVRSLSSEETTGLDDLKFAVLCNLEPFTEVTEDVVAGILVKTPSIPEDVYKQYSALLKDYKDANIDVIRHLQLKLYMDKLA
jgi:hypothetical protein